MRIQAVGIGYDQVMGCISFLKLVCFRPRPIPYPGRRVNQLPGALPTGHPRLRVLYGACVGSQVLFQLQHKAGMKMAVA